jgi:hypothetical protein
LWIEPRIFDPKVSPKDTANFNQVLSEDLYDIVFNKLTFFGPNMSCEQKKTKRIASAFEKNSILSQKTMKKPVFFDFLDFQAPGADISTPNFKNS